jgi:drug/metabolite transporter (DMT)-like permease
MTLLLYGLGAALCWGTADFFGGLQSRSLPVLAVTLWSQIVGGIALAAVLVASGQEPSRVGILWGIGAGFFGGFALVCFYRGLAVGVMSIVAPISACGAVVPVVLAFLMGQAPGVVTSLGIVAALGGIALASLQPAAGPAEQPRERQSLLFALGAALGFGLFYVLLDRGADAAPSGPLWVVAGTRIGSLAMVAALIAAGPRSAPWPGRRIATVGLIGVIDTSANALFAFGAMRDEAGVVAVLASLYPVATVILGRIVLAERLTRAQQAGVALALGGVALLSL